jgi:CheY-like chemotaxis protein
VLIEVRRWWPEGGIVRHILVIEDDAATRDVLAAALDTSGYEAVLASDLGSAWEELQAGERPVAVLCDTQVDVRELMGRMRSDPALLGIPVFLVSKPFDSVDAIEQLVERMRSPVPSFAPRPD